MIFIGFLIIVVYEKSKRNYLKFDDSKTNVHIIHMPIAKVGHDTEMYKAKDEVYGKPPDCSKYDRTEEKDTYEGHQHKTVT